MAEILMPKPPKKHHWCVEKRIGGGLSGEDKLKVSLRRNGGFPLYLSEMVAWEWVGWDSDAEKNARNAMGVAESILSSREYTEGNGLNGLAGYVWGGASR